MGWLVPVTLGLWAVFLAMCPTASPLPACLTSSFTHSFAHSLLEHFLKNIIYLFIYLFFGHAARGILVPRPGIEPTPPALSLNHWTTGGPWKTF